MRQTPRSLPHSDVDGIGGRRYDLTMSYFRRSRTGSSARLAAAVTLILALVTPTAIVGYPVPQQKETFEQPLSREVSCVLTADSQARKQHRPALIFVRLENLSDRDLDLVTVPTLYLRNADVTYWAPTDIIQNRALDTRKLAFGNEAVSIKPVPLKVHLDKHGSSVFQVDGAKTKWEREISSLWPSLCLSALRPGLYSLRLELSDTSGNLIKSNEVKVALEKADSGEK
jgi:hypothetical protein